MEVENAKMKMALLWDFDKRVWWGFGCIKDVLWDLSKGFHEKNATSTYSHTIIFGQNPLSLL